LEMLIATTLVLLMMLLFAEVFGLATETVSMRKGMAENDQKARLLTARFDNDLTARTFRTVAPYRGRVFDYDLLRAVVVDADGDGTPETVDTAGWRPAQARDGGLPVFVTRDVSAGSGTPAIGTAVVKGSLDGRRGFFSISENDPDNDGDDVIVFTIDRRLLQGRGGVTYSPAQGRAAVLNTEGQLFATAGGTVLANQPATDQFNTSGSREGLDGAEPLFGTGIGTQALNNASAVGVSNYEIVTFFLRNGNLIRSRKLVREATSDPDALWDSDSDGTADAWPPNAASPSFAAFFDYAAYLDPRALQAGSPTNRGPQLHSEASLDNEAGGDLIFADFNGDGFDEYRGPISLGNPYLRDGSGFFPFNVANDGRTQPFGRPREFRGKQFGPDLTFAGFGALDSPEWDTAFLGRYTAQEQSQAIFNLPGRRPFNPASFDPSVRANSGPIFASDIGDYVGAAAATRDRRGEEILLSNVHGFDIEVFDDAIGDFVDLGHNRTAPTQDIFDVDGDGDFAESIQVAGDYHADRLVSLTPMGDSALDTVGDAQTDPAPGSNAYFPHPFGNRFDTWHPEMTLMSVGFVSDRTGGSVPVALERPYPPPYRPLRNPFGGDVGFPTRDDMGNFINPDLTFTGSGGLVSAADLNGAVNFATNPVTTVGLVTAAGGFFDANGQVREDLPTHTPPGGGSGSGYYARGFVAGDPLPRLFPDPNAYGAPGTGDEKPLRAIRVTVRFYDVSSDRMREESFRHAFTD
ncbi:MAG: hypothetical protein AAF907_07435, partial [Planctomycetota bacterium]